MNLCEKEWHYWDNLSRPFRRCIECGLVIEFVGTKWRRRMLMTLEASE